MIDIEENVELLRRSGRFSSEEEFLEEAFRALLDKRPKLQLADEIVGSSLAFTDAVSRSGT